MSLPTRTELDAARNRAASIRRRMIALQEELDWRCYRLYGLLGDDGSLDEGRRPESGEPGAETLDSAALHPGYRLEIEDPPEIALGERAFEIVLARRMQEGEETTWFARHGSTPITEVPAHWPEDYRRIVERRIRLIESDRNIGLIERPEYKRRWNSESWEDQEQRALRSWLLDRLEDPRYWHGEPRLTSVARLADIARLDAEFMQMAELYTGRGDFDAAALVAQLVESESVPFLPVLRYKESGLRKRAEWEACWEKQRWEDAIDAVVQAKFQVNRSLDEGRRPESGEPGAETLDSAALHPGYRLDPQYRRGDEDNAQSAADAPGHGAARQAIPTENADLRAEIAAEQKRRKKAEVGDIPVPPKYKSPDFLSNSFWRLRGGLDVPKERFVSYPYCARDADGSLVVAWAGWDHLQRATALATYYLDMKDNEGWAPERLKPLLAGIQEIVPWLKQWHNEYDPEHATRMGDYFASFVIDEARGLGFTLDDLRAWRPTETKRRRGGRGW